MNQESEDAAFFGVVGNPTTVKNCGIVDRPSLRRPGPVKVPSSPRIRHILRYFHLFPRRRQQKQDEMVNNNRPEPNDEARPPPHHVVPNGHPGTGLFDR